MSNGGGGYGDVFRVDPAQEAATKAAGPSAPGNYWVPGVSGRGGRAGYWADPTKSGDSGLMGALSQGVGNAGLTLGPLGPALAAAYFGGPEALAALQGGSEASIPGVVDGAGTSIADAFPSGGVSGLAQVGGTPAGAGFLDPAAMASGGAAGTAGSAGYGGAADAAGASGISGGSTLANGAKSIWDYASSHPNLISTGASLIGAKMGSDAATSAANTQAQSANDSLNFQKQIYGDSVARSQPFYNTSVAANSKLSGLLGLNGSSPVDVMAQDPGYQFRMDQGTNAVNNSAAARGGVLSGGTLKAIQKYGQDYASGEFNNVYNRLSSTAGGGQVANNMNSNAANYGNNATNLITGAGNAQAAGQVGSANAWTNGIQGAVNNYQQNQLYNLLSNKATA